MKKRFLIFLFVVSLLESTALFAQSTVLSDKRLTLLTFGDSNGTFPHSWPEQLKLALPNAQIHNISKSGRTIGFVNNGDSTLNALLVTEQNLKKAAELTRSQPYDFIIIELGTNDGKAVFADRQAEVPGNLGKLIGLIKRCPSDVIRNASIIIISPPPYGAKAEATAKYAGGGQRVKTMSKAFRKVARQHGCLFVDGFRTPGLDIETMTTDGLHLDATASRKLIEPVVALMLK
ncbi:GDSL-type esterase/lipase family protein [Fibrella forsythiae]|uniref:SGNH hydrolase-type esterase domain-containing protein n=1 Tax=Fibrella forsythiae TaxID=2817061 RepID=A0ABS3JQA3_9BACT|nr:GDSL-type esterase/lipase family protein [Fibrella forsythiae]MBO0952185.1 hypothetical protein [Fibrella forsythiae]